MGVFGNPFDNGRTGRPRSIFGSDGSLTTVTGNGTTAFSSDGTVYTRCGNTILSSKGKTLMDTPAGLVGSDGTFYTKAGNSLFGSDGTWYTSA